MRLCPQARGEWMPLTFGATMYVIVGDPIEPISANSFVHLGELFC